MRYFTDQYAKTIPSLADATDPAAVMADAATIYDLVIATEFVDDGALRRSAEARGIDPDRFNAAVGVLRDTGRLLAVDSAPVPPEELSAATPRKRTRKSAS